MQEIAKNDKLPDETSQTVPDETTNNVNLEGRYHQTQSEGDNASVPKAPDTEAQPSLLLTEFSKAEWNRWLPESEKTPANTENKVYEMRNRNKNSNQRYSSRKMKSVNYKDQTNDDNDQDNDYEPKMSPPLPLDNKKHPSANRMAIQQGILSNRTSKLQKNAATLQDEAQDDSVSPQIPRPSNVANLDTLDCLKQEDEVKPCHDVGKLPDETDNPTTSDSPSVSPKSDMPESDKNIKGEFKTKTISIRCAKDPRTFKCSQCDKRTSTLQELNAHSQSLQTKM